MSLMSLAQAQALLPGARLVGSPDLVFDRVHTDTRSLAAGDLFVALRGERFDAHAFLPAARQAGAVAAIAGHGLAEAGLPGLLVDDPLQALQQFARGWRATQQMPLIAVTGSNGKTTVTQMIAGILRTAHGAKALATAGNLNNHIGVPLTLLRLNRHAAAVVELGMNHPGEIAELAALAQPTVALVNNAQREHQEFMHSVEAVAHENGSVIGALAADGVAVYPADDAHAAVWDALSGPRRRLRFALDTPEDAGMGSAMDAELRGQAVWVDGHWAVVLHTPAGTAELALQVAGRHNVRNALAAAAAALAAGIALPDIVAGLNAFRAVKGRSQVGSLSLDGRQVTLIDDSYNANPDSVRAAIEVLAELPGPRWLVLGDMGEVGDQGPQFHAEIGAYAAERGIEQVWLAGPLSAHAAQACGARARHFAGTAELVAALGQRPACASLLVKGSRFMKMEQVIAALSAAAEGGPHAA